MEPGEKNRLRHGLFILLAACLITFAILRLHGWPAFIVGAAGGSILVFAVRGLLLSSRSA